MMLTIVSDTITSFLHAPSILYWFTALYFKSDDVGFGGLLTHFLGLQMLFFEERMLRAVFFHTAKMLIKIEAAY